MADDLRGRGHHRNPALSREEGAMRLREVITCPRVMLIGMILGMWPVWRWYVLRSIDGSDEPWGLFALATLIALAVRNGFTLPTTTRRFIAPAILLSIYVLTFRSLSPLPRAIIAVAALGALCFPQRTAVAHGALLALSLPIIASVQFYFGYPLRVLAAEASVAALRLLDFDVTREGSLLHWRGETIMVDAPCGGVRMLWVGFYLAASIAVWSRLDNLRALILFAATAVLVIGANAVRATLLFFKEAGIVAMPEWTHAGIGVIMFAVAALIIVRCAQFPEVKPCRS
jgi:exosortase/archaeosortase family protein